MRVGVVSEYYDRTGSTPTVLFDLVNHLRRTRPDLTFDIVASRNQYRGSKLLPFREDSDGVEITRLNTPKSNRPSTAVRLGAGFAFTAAATIELMRRPKHDVLLVVTNPPSLVMAARTLKALRGTPYVYLVHDLYPDVANVLGVLPRESRASRALASLQRQWLRSAARTIVLGRCMRDYVIRNYSVASDRIDVIPNWGDPEAIQPSTTSRFRSANDLDGIVALYSGNFGQHQDFDVILNAAKILQEKRSPIVVALAGSGAQKPRIMRRINEERISNVKVFPLAQRDDYSDMLAAADIGLVTLAGGAEGIGVPSKFYNILASGRPTVAVVAPTSEVALVLNEARAGLQVNPGDASALAEALESLANSQSDRAEMGTNARKVLVDRFTLDTIGESFYSTLVTAALRPT